MLCRPVNINGSSNAAPDARGVRRRMCACSKGGDPRNGRARAGASQAGQKHERSATRHGGRLAADAVLKAEVDALRVSILATGRATANEDPTLRRLALAAHSEAREKDQADRHDCNLKLVR